MYAVMIDTDYVQKETFRDNFWNDWRKLLGKNHVIQKLDACDFKPIYDWYQKEKEKKKQMTTEVSWWYPLIGFTNQTVIVSINWFYWQDYFSTCLLYFLY